MGRDGGYAEYMIAPARFLHRVPDLVPLLTACLCEPLAVVLKGLRRLERTWDSAKNRRDCAVVGAGPMGHLAARVLAERGYAVTVFDRDPRRLQYFGGSQIQIQSHREALPRFDTIVETAGDPAALDEILKASTSGSTVLLLGLPYARHDFQVGAIIGYDKTLVGSMGSSSEDYREAMALLPKITTDALTGMVLGLAEFRQAWEMLRVRAHLKVVLRVGATDAELPPHR